MSEKARKMFNDLADKLNLRCPRCEAAFHDYDGCNALTCSIPECRAAFCAICLIDCGNDAHGHVRIAHGDLFDKTAFHTSTNIRAKAQIEILKDKLSHESFELRQLVMNHIEKAKLMQDSISHNNASARTAAFLEKSKASLSLAVRSDRLALLNDPEVYGREQITPENISPRCVIPSDYRLSLTRTTEEDIYRILLEHNSRPDTWIRVDDIEAHFKENPKIESLLNVFQALHCAVIAFDGKAVLYQSSRGTVSGRRQIAKGEVCIRLRAIDRYGNVRIDDDVHYGRMNIIGLNQNMRLLDLEKYVQNASQSDLMFESLQHFVGVGLPRALITEMEMDPPDSYLDLNEEQKKVAHPLRLKTAMEVAGPPGTGKTKTIIELVRGLLQCTNYDILVLSERNGAINAVAEKFKSESINMKEKKIIDLQVWQSVMTYGAGDTMGDSTKLFTLEQKLE
jgi:protein-arginine kinase activator protein McsA